VRALRRVSTLNRRCRRTTISRWSSSILSSMSAKQRQLGEHLPSIRGTGIVHGTYQLGEPSPCRWRDEPPRLSPRWH
jgi:hypothetical protein